MRLQCSGIVCVCVQERLTSHHRRRWLGFGWFLCEALVALRERVAGGFV